MELLTPAAVVAVMTHNFEKPLTLALGTKSANVVCVEDAVTLLASVDWPGTRGPKHRDAYETCLKVIEGNRSVEDAEARFAEAVAEAGLDG